MKPDNKPTSKSKDMHGRGKPEKKTRLRLNTELEEDLSAKLRTDSAAQKIDQSDMVRAAIKAMLFPGKTRKIFEALLEAKFERQRQDLIHEAFCLFSAIRTEAIFFEPEHPLIHHVHAALMSAKINDIRFRLEALIRQVGVLKGRRAKATQTKQVPQMPDESEEEKEGES